MRVLKSQERVSMGYSLQRPRAPFAALPSTSKNLRPLVSMGYSLQRPRAPEKTSCRNREFRSDQVSMGYSLQRPRAPFHPPVFSDEL